MKHKHTQGGYAPPCTARGVGAAIAPTYVCSSSKALKILWGQTHKSEKNFNPLHG